MNKKELDLIMRKIQNGDEDAFAIFYHETYKGLFSFIYSYVKNWHTSEDIMQETYIKVKLNSEKYLIGTNVTAWLFQIAKNLCLDFLKKPINQNSVPIEDVHLEKIYESDTKMYVHDLLNKYLSTTDRQIVLLHILHGYKNREIAQILQLPLGTVLWKYNRAMKELKTKIKED